jgi:hypothetical protein
MLRSSTRAWCGHTLFPASANRTPPVSFPAALRHGPNPPTAANPEVRLLAATDSLGTSCPALTFARNVRRLCVSASPASGSHYRSRASTATGSGRDGSLTGTSAARNTWNRMERSAVRMPSTAARALQGTLAAGGYAECIKPWSCGKGRAARYHSLLGHRCAPVAWTRAAKVLSGAISMPHILVTKRLITPLSRRSSQS